MKKTQTDPIQYSIEREFLAKFSATELIKRIIKQHLHDNNSQEQA